MPRIGGLNKMVGGITFTGLFSGLSTSDIVDALVGLRRTSIDQLETLAERKSFEKIAFQQVNTSILGIKRALLNLRLEATFLSKSAQSSSPSLVGVQAGFNARPATYSMTVQSIARGAKAVSGLDTRLLERAAARMAVGNTAGITGVEMTANQLGGTRALANTLLTDTLQAGTGAAAITAGDKIKIDVTLKDGSSNTHYFEFAGNATDTIDRLRQAVGVAFQGQAQVVIDRNGAFQITETNPASAGTISLDNLTFIDSDYSGSTFSISTGNTMAGNFATARTIIGSRTFTTGSSANIADGSEYLINLDQYNGGSLGGDETIEISGTKYNGDSVSSSFAVTSTTTLNDLIAELQTLFNDDPNPPWETNISLENGKIVFRDESTGTSQTSISMYFYDPSNIANLNTGTFVTVDEGSADVTQTILTSNFTVAAKGRHLVTATEGRAGAVTGTVSLNADTILDSLGVTTVGLFTIDRDDGSGAVDPVTIFGVTTRSTVQDLIDAINAQVPGVTAQLVDDGAGAFNLRIMASEGGVDIRLTDESTGSGILENVLNLDPLNIDTDISTALDSALDAVDSATTDSTDYTFTTLFKPDNGGPEQRRTVSGTDGSPVTDLIANVQINGGGNAFHSGLALIYTAQSSELNVAPAIQQFIIGQSGVSDGSHTSTPPLNIYTTINNSGLSTAVTSGTFSINGVSITIDNPATMTLDELMGMVNSSGAGVLMEYDPVFDRFLLYRPDAGNTSTITLGGTGDTSNALNALGLQSITGAVQMRGATAGVLQTESALAYSGLSIPLVSGTFTINGVKITVNAGADSLDDIIDRINDSPAGVIAEYDSIKDRLILTQDLNEPPLYNQIQIGSATDTSNFWASMRLTDSYQQSQYIGSERVRSQFTIDGELFIRDTNAIDDVINDATLTLKGVTNSPVAIEIASDTTRATEAIRDFVVAYNELIDLVNIAPLSDDERKNLNALTESQKAKLTSAEIDAYESNREVLWVRELLYRSTTLSRLDNALKLNIFSPVKSVTGDFRMLSDLGISTGIIGQGIDLSRTSYLVADSTDPDVILAKLNENSKLQNALQNNAEKVLELFGNPIKSTVEVVGNVDLTQGMSLAASLSFSIGNGTTQVTVNFGAGFHSSSQILSTIQNSLNQTGLGESYRVYLTDGGFLQITGESDSGRARIVIQDLNAGSSIVNKLGISTQTALGENAMMNAGYSRRLDSFFNGYVGTEGILSEKIKIGGLIDSELLRISKRIDDYEYRLSLYEARLKNQFTAMELALAAFQQTSSFLEARTGVTSQLSSSNQSGGIPISL